MGTIRGIFEGGSIRYHTGASLPLSFSSKFALRNKLPARLDSFSFRRDTSSV
jgi:hypothetical protein